MEKVNERKLSISDQVKAAERDKYLAEASKAIAEETKVIYDLEQSKKWHNGIVFKGVVTIAFIGLFVNFVLIPTFNLNKIKLETLLANEKDSLSKQQHN